MESSLVYWAMAAGVVALVFAFFKSAWIKRQDPGNQTLQDIGAAVREGAMAFLSREYRILAVFVVVVAGLLIFFNKGDLRYVGASFLVGAVCSGLAGIFGMRVATMANSRTANSARQGLNPALMVAFSGGSVMGMSVVGLGLLGLSALFAVYITIWGADLDALKSSVLPVLSGFSLGASSIALFARVGGGIYTKAADVGADLVGKVEAGIPEDDPRNPATIADNVGDNVGDVAGMGADLYESYAGSILATAALGVAAATVAGWDATKTFAFLAAPMLLAAVGIVLSVFGIFLVRTREDANMKALLGALNRGIYVSSVLIIVAAWLLVKFLAMPLGVFWAITIGVVLGIVIGKGTEYATAAEYKPTQFIADQAATGPATVIIGGIAEGMMSTWIPVLAVCVGTLLSFGVMDGFQDLLAGLYGVGIAAVGMLSTLGLTLATDAYGPIADNAGGNAEMSELPKEVRKRTDALDSLGNTTAAIGKGFAIGSAALTALALLASYIEEVRIGIHREAAVEYVAPADGQPYVFASIGADYNKKWAIFLPGAKPGNLEEQMFHTLSAFEGAGSSAVVLKDDTGVEHSIIINEIGELVKGVAVMDINGKSLTSGKASLKDFMTLYDASLMNPKVLVGVFIGVLAVFVFSALTMKAVGRAAFAMVQEVRRQFKEKPGIMEGTERPDYARCVAISTAGAQREMLLPSILAISLPVATGLVLNVSGVLGLLVGGLCAGFSVAVFMANSGGAWDNAKKYIEAGHLGGKGSLAHKAAVVGDTVGDPFKDTCGPSLNILIKLMTMVSIVFAGLIVKYAPAIGHWLNLGN
ncbi:MAG TPA: sodium-translocating pyrophosphatase [Kiritimatiellia bacterium]|nr:sodium-translocating pyrophosphatase [Kiritimatiellia bacterium]